MRAIYSKRLPCTVVRIIMIYIGIDPGDAKGKEGAIAILNSEQNRIEIYNCPQTIQERVNLLDGIAYGYGPSKKVVATIEKASKVIRIGKKTYHSTVLWGNYQAWLGILSALFIKHEIVPPRRWQTILDGNKKLSTKERAWETACRLYPEAMKFLHGRRNKKGELAKKYGRSDALMILEYGRRKIWE